MNFISIDQEMKTQCILKVWKKSSFVQAEPIHYGLKLCQIDACGLVSTSPLSHSGMIPQAERHAVEQSGVEWSGVDWSTAEQVGAYLCAHVCVCVCVCVCALWI